MVRERAIRFGTDKSLVGILAEPREGKGTVGPAVPAVLILNAGILHRVGPSRVHVALARRLAADGFPSLRFDFSGIGDSEPRRDGIQFDEATILEIKDAMNFLSDRLGVNRFVVGGICSGADASFRAAGEDPRIVGFFQIDGYGYRNLRYHLHHYLPRLLRPASWVNFITRQAGKLLKLLRFREPNDEEGSRWTTTVLSFPARQEVAGKLGRLAEMGVQQLHIYTAGHERHYNYPNQFFDNFRSVDFKGTARLEFLPDADHIFTPLDQQRLLVDLIAGWVSDVWGSVPAHAAETSR